VSHRGPIGRRKRLGESATEILRASIAVSPVSCPRSVPVP